MAYYKKFVLFAFALLMQAYGFAQSAVVETKANDDGFMRSEGKIYVVMAVVITILAGLIIYVVRLDRKISRLEKGQNF